MKSQDISITFEITIRRADWKGKTVERSFKVETPERIISQLPLKEMAVSVLENAISEYTQEPIPEIEEREGESQD